MTYHTTEAPRPFVAGSWKSGLPGLLILLLIGAVVAFGLSRVDPARDPMANFVSDHFELEDWHGNVRRSH